MPCDIMTVMMEIMSSIMSMEELFVLPLIVDLVDKKRVMISDMTAWLVSVQVMDISVRVISFDVIVTSVSVKVKVVVGIMIIMSVLMSMMVHWLHLQNKIASRCVNIGWVEHRAIGLESTTGLVPPSTVESIKIVSPVEFELIGVSIVCEDLYIVVEHIPRHVSWIKSFSPRVEGWGPEVHSQGLVLLHKLHSSVISWNMTDLMTIDRP